MEPQADHDLLRAIRASGRGPRDHEPLDDVGIRNAVSVLFLRYLVEGDAAALVRAIELEDRLRAARRTL